MAASKHMGIRDAVEALLVAAAAGGGAVDANVDRPLATDLPWKISVRRERSTPSQATTNTPIDWSTELTVEIDARDEATADDLMCTCFAAVMADEDLGGLAQGIEVGAFEWDQAQAEVPVHRTTWSLTVLHVTTDNVIT